MGFKHANATAEGASVTLSQQGEGVKTAGDGQFTIKSYSDDGQNAVIASANGSEFTVPADELIPVGVD
jgi:hypothetical protein